MVRRESVNDANASYTKSSLWILLCVLATVCFVSSQSCHMRSSTVPIQASRRNSETAEGGCMSRYFPEAVTEHDRAMVAVRLLGEALAKYGADWRMARLYYVSPVAAAKAWRKAV